MCKISDFFNTQRTGASSAVAAAAVTDGRMLATAGEAEGRWVCWGAAPPPWHWRQQSPNHKRENFSKIFFNFQVRKKLTKSIKKNENSEKSNKTA